MSHSAALIIMSRCLSDMEALPDRRDHTVWFDMEEMLEALPWMDQNYLIVAIQKGFPLVPWLPHILQRADEDPELEDFILKKLATWLPFGALISSPSSQIWRGASPRLLAEFLRAQVTSFPDAMHRAFFSLSMNSPERAIALVLAGLHVEKRHFGHASQRMMQLAVSIESNHGRLHLFSKLAPIETYLENPDAALRQYLAGA